VSTQNPALEGSFDQWWDAYGEWFDPQGPSPTGESGIQRLHTPDGRLLYSKRQVNHFHRDLTHPLGQPTLLHEMQAMQALARLGIGVPRVVFGGARKVEGESQALLVTEALDGYESLEDWYARPHAVELRQRVIQQLANTLGRLHRAGWEHGRLSPNNLFLRVIEGRDPKVDIALLGLAQAEHRMTAHSASRHDFEYFKQHHKPMPDEDWKAFVRAYGDVMESDYIR
jgi:tRNA A-37 threonylcarbamoyl transferase component Bud32